MKKVTSRIIKAEIIFTVFYSTFKQNRTKMEKYVKNLNFRIRLCPFSTTNETELFTVNISF